MVPQFMKDGARRLLGHAPCPKCGSSDALAKYDDGYEKCFSSGCGHYKYNKEQPSSTQKMDKQPYDNNLIQDFTIKAINARGLTEQTCKLFGYGVHKTKGGEMLHVANYYDKNGEIIAQKTRDSNKNFRFLGDGAKASLFGQYVNQNDHNILTIVEGEIDAMSLSQVHNHKYPVVSIPKGISDAVNSIRKNLEYVESFNKVVFIFDNEPEAQNMAKECCKLIKPGKGFTYAFPLKDANEMLLAGREDEMRLAVFKAKEFRPDGLVSPEDFADEDLMALFKPGITIPFPKLSEKLRGLQPGAVYTLAAREKAGKSLFTKELALHLCKSGTKVGGIYLEEDAAEAALSFVCMEKNLPAWQVRENIDLIGGLPGLHKGLKELSDLGLTLYNHKGEMAPKTLLTIMRYMAVGCGCKLIILDNISIALASDGEDLATTNQIVSQMVSLCKNTGVTLINVAHLKKNRVDAEGKDSETVQAADLFGTGSFAKFSYGLLAIERNPQNNTTKLKVIRNRTTGWEGYCDSLQYNPSTGRLTVYTGVEDDNIKF